MRFTFRLSASLHHLRCAVIRLFVVVCMAVLPAIAAAQQPAELTPVQEQLAAALKPLSAQRDSRIAAAREVYSAALDKLQRETTARGDLDGAVAAKQERERLAARSLTAEDKKTLPKTILPYREVFDRAVAQALAAAWSEEARVTRTHLPVLEALQKRITVQGRLEEAARVKQERERLLARVTALETGKGAAAFPDLDPVGAAVVAPLPSGTTATGLGVSSLAVAAKLATKEGATAPIAGSIVFDGPKGDGRSGSKGLLLRMDAPLVRSGSTWMFRFTRGGTAYGIHIIHPFGRGQVIVGLSSNSVGLTTPEAWREVGFGTGESKRVNKTSAYAKIFPLKDDQEYAVASRLSVGGAFELFVNGQLVARGHVGSAHPLSLEIPASAGFPLSGRAPLEFKGPDLPKQWAAGWAGLILGPMDRGINRCEEIRYFPGLAPVEPAAR